MPSLTSRRLINSVVFAVTIGSASLTPSVVLGADRSDAEELQSWLLLFVAVVTMLSIACLVLRSKYVVLWTIAAISAPYVAIPVFEFGGALGYGDEVSANVKSLRIEGAPGWPGALVTTVAIATIGFLYRHHLVSRPLEPTAENSLRPRTSDDLEFLILQIAVQDNLGDEAEQDILMRELLRQVVLGNRSPKDAADTLGLPWNSNTRKLWLSAHGKLVARLDDLLFVLLRRRALLPSFAAFRHQIEAYLNGLPTHK